MFTAGIGAFFRLRRGGRSKADLSRFLWTRGVWLVLLEFTVVQFAMTFSLTSGMVLTIALHNLRASGNQRMWGSAAVVPCRSGDGGAFIPEDNEYPRRLTSCR